MPKIEFKCNAKPSLFAYPNKLEEKKKDSNEKVETVQLSITAKDKSKKADKTSKEAIAKSPVSIKKASSEKADEKMEVDEKKPVDNAIPSKAEEK